MTPNGHHPTPVATTELVTIWIQSGMIKTLPEFLADKERNNEYANTRTKDKALKDVARKVVC